MPSAATPTMGRSLQAFELAAYRSDYRPMSSRPRSGLISPAEAAAAVHRGVPPEQQASIEHLTIGALDQLLPILQRRCSSAEVASKKATQAAQDASRCTQGAIARCEIVETALNGICDACAEYSCLTSVVRAPGAEVPVQVCRICGAGVEAVRAPPRKSERSSTPPRLSTTISQAAYKVQYEAIPPSVGGRVGMADTSPPARPSTPREGANSSDANSKDLWHLWEQQVIQQHAHQSARKQHRQQQVQQVQKILSDFGQDQAQRHLNFKEMQRRIYELEDQQQHTQDQQCQLQQLRSNLKKQQKQQEECDQALVQQLSQQRLMYLTTATLPLDDTLYDDEQEFAGMRALDPPRSVRQEQLQRARFERKVMQERLDSAAQLAANAVAVEERARALVDWATARRAQLQADLETAADRRRQQQLAVAQAEMEAVRKRVAQLGGATDKASGALSTDPRRSEISASQECPVCFQSPRDCGLQCGHQLCMQCADRVQQCPVCRQEISLRLKLYH